MHGSNDAACGIENDIQIDHAQCDALVNYAQQDKDVGNEDGGEQLQEIFDPEVHDPKAPKVRSREMVSGVGEQANRVEGNCRLPEPTLQFSLRLIKTG